MILISLIQFVDLERKRLNYHRSLVAFSWKAKHFVFASFLKLPLFTQPFQNIGEFGAKSYFIDHQTAYTIRLIAAIKVFWFILFQNKLQQKGFPRDYLINVATCRNWSAGTDLVTFIEEILNGKLYILCSVK